MNRIGPGPRMRCAAQSSRWAGVEWRRPRSGRPEPQSFRPPPRSNMCHLGALLCWKNINRFHSTLCGKQKRHFKPLFRTSQMGYLYLTERSKNKNKTYFVVCISTKVFSVGDLSRHSAEATKDTFSPCFSRTMCVTLSLHFADAT